MVGPGRLELPTPRLSSVCSNRLSYGPDLRVHTPTEPDRRQPIERRSDHQTGAKPHAGRPAPRPELERQSRDSVRTYPKRERETWTAVIRLTTVNPKVHLNSVCVAIVT